MSEEYTVSEEIIVSETPEVEVTQPTKAKKKAKAVEPTPELVSNEKFPDGSHVIFTAKYPSYDQHSNVKYMPNGRYEAVINSSTKAGKHIKRLLETGTLVPIST